MTDSGPGDSAADDEGESRRKLLPPPLFGAVSGFDPPAEVGHAADIQPAHLHEPELPGDTGHRLGQHESPGATVRHPGHELPGSEGHQPTVHETPGNLSHQPTVHETPGNLSHQPTVHETPGNLSHQPTVHETPGNFNHQPTVHETPGNFAHQPIGQETAPWAPPVRQTSVESPGAPPTHAVESARRVVRSRPRTIAWVGVAVGTAAVATIIVVATRGNNDRSVTAATTPVTVAATATTTLPPTTAAAPVTTALTAPVTAPAATSSPATPATQATVAATTPATTAESTTTLPASTTSAAPAAIIRTGATSNTGSAAQDGTFELQFTTEVLTPDVQPGQAFGVHVNDTLTGPAWARNNSTGVWTIECHFTANSSTHTGPINLFLIPVAEVSDAGSLYSLPAQARAAGSAAGVGGQYPGLIRASGTGAGTVSTTPNGCTLTNGFDTTGQVVVPAGTAPGEYFVVPEGFAKRDWKDCDSSCTGTYTSIGGVPPTIVVQPPS